jgi:hypothetical protein
MSIPSRSGILITFLLASGLIAHGQQQLSGSYKMYRDEKLICEEKFVLTINADGSRRSEAEITQGTDKIKAITVTAGNRPVSFSFTAGNLKGLAVEFSEEAAKIMTPGFPERSVKTRASVLLEDDFYHYFINILAQYDVTRGGQQAFKAFLPSLALEVDFRLERIGPADFMVEGRTVKTECYRILTANDLVVELWADEAQVPLLIRVPSMKEKVIRGGAEALAAVVFSLQR